MKRKFLFALIAILPFCNNTWAQDDFLEEENDSSAFFFGINFGAHFANNKTAVIHTGAPNITAYGYDYIFSRPQLQPIFQNYFVYDYYIAEDPVDPVYKTTAEIGLHVGYKINSEISIYADLNSVQLDYEQFFTVGIRNPTNQSPNDDLERIPVIGKETRFNLNLGTQFSIYNNENNTAYFAVFANANDVEMGRNYIVVNTIQYEILHPVDGNFNRKPQGVGYGGGFGLGVKFNLSERILSDFNYNLYYTKTNLTENLNPFGIHHSIGLRVIWE